MNTGFAPQNKLSYPEYLLKSLIQITNNTSPTYNIGVFLDSVIRYVSLHHELFGKYEGELMQKPNDHILSKTSGNFKTFLEGEELAPLIPLFILSHTAQGYGYLDEIGALYGLMWNTPALVSTVALRAVGISQDPYKTYILKKGFEHVWNTIVKKEKFDIRFDTTIEKVQRNQEYVKIIYKKTTTKLRTEKCGFLIWTPPMTELLKYTSTPNPKEYSLFHSLVPHVFVSSLMREKGTIRNHPITYYRESLQDKIEGAITADMDTEGTLNYCEENCLGNLSQYDEIVNTSRILTVLQLQRNHTSETKSVQMVREHYETGFNASEIEMLSTISWEYFHKWGPEDLAKGYHWKVFEMQGLYRTWYTGASVSFESVKSVIEYNKLLLRQFGK